jgi:hypothetical protein
VHHRLVANQQEVVNLRSFVANGFESIGTQISDAFIRQDEAMTTRDRQTGELYMSLAQRLLGEGSSRPLSSRRTPVEEDRNSEEQEDETTTTTNNRGGVLMTRPHSLVMKHKSIHTIYYEWYGLETFANSPVEGGIASLEKQFKTKWRKHFLPAEKQYFSRLQKVVKGIEEQGRREAKEPDTVLDDWGSLYQEEAKSSVTKMAQMIQEMGLVVTRKARGKTQINQQLE